MPLQDANPTPSFGGFGLNGATVVVTLSEGNYDASLSNGDFTLNSAPTGTSVTGVVRDSATQATLTLTYDSTDFDSDASMSVTVNQSGLLASDTLGPATTGSVNIDGFFEAAPSISTTTPSTLTESNLNGATLVITLSEGNYDSSLVNGDFGLNSAPTGTSVTSVVRDSATQATLTLTYDSTDFDSNASMSVTVNQSGLLATDTLGPATTSAVTITAFFEATASISTTTPSTLTESNLNGATAVITLGEGNYDSSLSTTDFTLNSAPTGTSVTGVVRDSATQATLTLTYDSTDFDADASMSVTVNQAGLASDTLGPATTSAVTVTAFFEAVAAISTTTPATLNEDNLNGATLVVTLSEGNYDSSLANGDFGLNGEPTGTSVSGVVRDSATQATLTLSFDNTDFDSNASMSVTVNQSGLLASDTLGPATTSAVTIVATVDASISSTNPATLTESNLNTATVTVTITEGTYDSSFSTSTDFTLNGAPTGTSIASAARDSATQATLTLAYDSTDFDSNASMSVTVNQAALATGTGPATTSAVTVSSFFEAVAAISTTTSSSLTKDNLNGATVVVTLSEGNYDSSLAAGDFTLNSAPTGTSISGVVRDSATQATLTLSFDDTDFDSDASMSVTVSQSGLLASDTLGPATTSAVTVTATVDASISSTNPATLTESNLNTATVTVTITEGTYDDPLATSTDFTLNGAPTGTSISSVVRDSGTQATLTLTYDSTDFDSNASMTVTVNQAALATGIGPATTSAVTVSSFFEAVAAVSSTNPSTLTESNLNGATVVVTLSEGNYDSSLSTGDFGLNSAPTGTSITGVVRDSATQATLTLTYDSTDFDSDASMSVTVNQSGLLASDTLGPATTSAVNIDGFFEAAAAISTTTPSTLTESKLNGATLVVTLSEGNYDSSLSTGDFGLNGAPSGTSVTGVVRDSATQATLTLTYDSTDFDSDASMSVTVNQSGLLASDTLGPATTGSVNIDAFFEAAPSVSTTTPSTLTESNLNGATLVVTLSEGNYDSSLVTGDFTLNSEPTGTSVTGVVRDSATQATLTLTYDSTDFDSDASMSVTVNQGGLASDTLGPATTSAVTVSAFLEAVAAISTTRPSTLTESNLNGATLVVMLSEGNYDGTLIPGDFVLNGAPTGTSISSVNRDSATQATLTLAFDGTDFDANASTTVTVNQNGFTSDTLGPATTSAVTVTAFFEAAPAISSTNPSSLTETNLDTATLVVTLSEGSYAAGLVPGDFGLNGEPAGTSISSMNRDSDTQVTLTLTFDGTDFDSNSSVSVTVNQSGLASDTTGPATTSAVTVTAVLEVAVSITSTNPASLTESNLSGATVVVTLGSGTYVASLVTGNFGLNGAPAGTTIASVTRDSDTQATLPLAFDGTDFDADASMRVIVNQSALDTGTGPGTTGTATVTAFFEAVASISSTNPVSLTESNMDGATLTVTLSEGNYDATLAAGDFSLNGAPAGTSISSVSRDSATQATLTLSFDGTDFDANVSMNVTVSQGALTTDTTGPATTGTVTVDGLLRGCGSDQHDDARFVE